MELCAWREVQTLAQTSICSAFTSPSVPPNLVHIDVQDPLLILDESSNTEQT